MIVTVTAYKRPELLERCLESLTNADLRLVTGVLVSLDHHSEQMTEDMKEAFWTYEHKLPKGTTLLHQVERLGVANHPRAVFNMLQEKAENTVGVDYLQATREPICAIEEDTIVSPDCFVFVDWALRQKGYQFVNLADHLKTGTDVSAIHEDWILSSPYGWAFTPAFWRQLEPRWNGKIRLPVGWDWQVTHLCYREGWKSLTPEVARVYNTGRGGGTYDTPDNWDRTQKDVVLCSTIPNKYVIVKHERPSTPPDWVIEEMRL